LIVLHFAQMNQINMVHTSTPEGTNDYQQVNVFGHGSLYQLIQMVQFIHVLLHLKGPTGNRMETS